MDGLSGKIPLKWMIWGYPDFRKPPYVEHGPFIDDTNDELMVISQFPNKFPEGTSLIPALPT